MSTEAPTEKLSDEFAAIAEWKAYENRVHRILAKRAIAKSLNKEETHILADYRLALALPRPPCHPHTKEPLPPILYGYGEAQEAFGVSKDILYSLRAQGSNAFTGSLILTVSLARSIQENPNPPPIPLNTIHTGAKGKLTPELQESILKSLRFSPILSVVAKAHGITGQTLANWRKKGEAGERKYVHFFEQSQAAIGAAQMGALQNIASNDSWQAQAKILEWTDPDRFGKKTSLSLTGKDGGPIKTDAPPPMTIVLNGLASHSYDPNAQPAPETGEPEEEAENGEGGE